MDIFTKKALKEKSEEELLAIVDELSEKLGKEFSDVEGKTKLVDLIYSIQSEEGQPKAKSETIYKVKKTFDTVIDGERFSMRAGDSGPIPDEIIEELAEGGFLHDPDEED